MFNSVISGSAKEVKGAPIRKCAGVRTLRSSGFSVIGHNGLEFEIAPIWQISARISSK